MLTENFSISHDLWLISFKVKSLLIKKQIYDSLIYFKVLNVVYVLLCCVAKTVLFSENNKCFNFFFILSS